MGRRRPGREKSVRSLGFSLGVVDSFSCGGPIFAREAAELFQQRGEAAIGAEVTDAGLIERGKVRGGGELSKGMLFQWFDVIEEPHNVIGFGRRRLGLG
jgi:hypothetical protein